MSSVKNRWRTAASPGSHPELIASLRSSTVSAVRGHRGRLAAARRRLRRLQDRMWLRSCDRRSLGRRRYRQRLRPVALRRSRDVQAVVPRWHGHLAGDQEEVRRSCFSDRAIRLSSWGLTLLETTDRAQGGSASAPAVVGGGQDDMLDPCQRSLTSCARSSSSRASVVRRVSVPRSLCGSPRMVGTSPPATGRRTTSGCTTGAAAGRSRSRRPCARREHARSQCPPDLEQIGTPSELFDVVQSTLGPATALVMAHQRVGRLGPDVDRCRELRPAFRCQRQGVVAADPGSHDGSPGVRGAGGSSPCDRPGRRQHPVRRQQGHWTGSSSPPPASSPTCASPPTR